MRSLEKGNKLSFVILGVVISFILALLSIFIINYSKNKSNEYKVVSGSVVYDKDNVFIKTKGEGNLTKKWNDEYYLNIGEEEHNLGKQSVIYNTNTGGLMAYGNIYKILEDASVSAEHADTEVDNNTPVSFYKLADRKYLITGNNIKVEEENLLLEKYLIVDIDKSGNSQIFNDKINLKMLNPINIEVEQYKFDVAKENLDINGELISLAKIGGSTNEFAGVDESNIDKDKNNDQNNDKNNGNSNNVSNSPENNIINGGQGSLIGGNGGQTIISGGSSNQGGVVNGGGSSNSTSKPENNKKPTESTLKINYIESKPNSLRVNYSVQDYENKFSSVYLLVEDSNENKQKIILNKSENIKNITGLSPDSNYTIYIGATTSTLKDGVEENIDTIMDEFKTRTSEINSHLELEKISSRDIKFNFKVDSELKLESANATLYVDGVEKEKIAVDVDKASTSLGWSSSFNISNYVNDAKNFNIKIEDAIYNGVNINITSEINVANGFVEKVKRSIQNLYNKLF